MSRKYPGIDSEKRWVFSRWRNVDSHSSDSILHLIEADIEWSAGMKAYSWPVWSWSMHCCDNSRPATLLHYCRHWRHLSTVKVSHVVPLCMTSACGCTTITATPPGLKLYCSCNYWNLFNWLVILCVRLQDFEVFCRVPCNSLCLHLLMQMHHIRHCILLTVCCENALCTFKYLIFERWPVSK